MKETGSGRPRILAFAHDADIRMRLAETLRAHPKLVVGQLTGAVFPELIDMGQAPMWAFAPTFDRLVEAAKTQVGLSALLAGAALPDGGAMVRHIRGLAYRRGAFPVLYDGVQVMYRAPDQKDTNGVLAFDMEGLALVDAPFQTAPPAKSAHAERWFRRRWNRALPGVPADDPYAALKHGRTDLVSVLEPLVTRAINALADDPAPAASST